MPTRSRKGIYLLAVAFVMAFFLSGSIAKADGVSDANHDEWKWSDSGSDKDSGSIGNITWYHGDSDNSDSDGSWFGGGQPNDEGGDGDNDGKDGDPAPKSMAEPSSLTLLTIGMLGLMALVRRQARNLGVRELA